ncbi:N-acetyltransferase [Staphylococcus aureus]|nr:N-acetyltransferase [Staphylococcus aureus]
MNIAKLEDYLQIEPTRYNQPSIEALNYYATRFMLTVPFENIDVQNGKPISVDIDALFNKIVHDKRGGFCYELNTFFKAYLQQKGFNPELMSATIHTPGGGRSQNGSHASLVVSINNVFYVTDVGFGDLPLNAIPITLPDDTQQITDISGTFRAIFNSEDKDIFYVQKYENNHWHTKYEAEFKAREIEEFDQNIEYNQTHPDSVFVKHLLITMPQSFGRATMSENHLTFNKRWNARKVSYHKR